MYLRYSVLRLNLDRHRGDLGWETADNRERIFLLLSAAVTQGHEADALFLSLFISQTKRHTASTTGVKLSAPSTLLPVIPNLHSADRDHIRWRFGIVLRCKSRLTIVVMPRRANSRSKQMSSDYISTSVILDFWTRVGETRAHQPLTATPCPTPGVNSPESRGKT